MILWGDVIVLGVIGVNSVNKGTFLHLNKMA